MPAISASPISNFCPINEHPFDGSWGYQPTGLYAPTSRFGSPEDFSALVDACHREGLGVLLDWVPGHFPDDPHGLGHFDGTALYEHANPLQGRHLDWGTLIYNYGRTEVVNFLVSNALFWLERYAHRRPARRCGRLDALSRLQPARGRLDPEQIWRPGKSRSHRLPAPLQHRSVRAAFRRPPRRRKNPPRGRRCRARSNMAGSASATNGTWAGCTTR